MKIFELLLHIYFQLISQNFILKKPFSFEKSKNLEKKNLNATKLLITVHFNFKVTKFDYI